jgi:hypothetical protein
MVLPIDEQETTIQILRNTKKAIIYTSDTKMRNRLNKLYSEHKSREFTQAGETVAEEFIIDSRMISFRSKLPEQKPITDEERARRRERMLELRARQLSKKE